MDVPNGQQLIGSLFVRSSDESKGESRFYPPGDEGPDRTNIAETLSE